MVIHPLPYCCTKGFVAVALTSRPTWGLLAVILSEPSCPEMATLPTAKPNPSLGLGCWARETHELAVKLLASMSVRAKCETYAMLFALIGLWNTTVSNRLCPTIRDCRHHALELPLS